MGLWLDAPARVKATVFNERGDVAAMQSQDLGAGPQALRMDATAFAQGVYFLLCTVDDGVNPPVKLPVLKFGVLP